jgi:HTTM domain
VSALRAASDRWRDFWFERVPPHTYALFCMALGLAGIVTVIGAWDPMFWSVTGLAPLPGGGLGIRQWLVDHDLGLAAGLGLRWLLLVGFVLLAAGVWSTATALVMFVLTSGMLWWNWYPFSGAQHLLHNLTIYLVFVDSGQVWSWDAWWARRRHMERPIQPEPMWPLRLLRYQVAMMYFAAGLWKLANPEWRAGTALHYVLNNNVFQRVPGEVPSELFPVTVLLTYITVGWELLFPFMLWFGATRWLALGLGVALHLGMWSTMEVGAFTPTVLAAYVAFLDPHRTEQLVSRIVSRARRLTIRIRSSATAFPSPSRRPSSAS